MKTGLLGIITLGLFGGALGAGLTLTYLEYSHIPNLLPDLSLFGISSVGLILSGIALIKGDTK